MKSRWILLTIIGIIALTGCTVDDPGYVNIANTPAITGDVKVVDSDGDIINIDKNTRTLTSIQFAHHAIHEGKAYTVLEVNDLGNGAVRDILIVTPDTTEWAHLVWEIEHELETTIEFYRDTVYTDRGTIMASFNRNGNSSNTATTLVYHTPTITNAGVLIGTIQQGDGKKAGGSDREGNEFMLRQNTSYMVRITNLTVNNNLVFIKLNWYEHVNED